MKDPSIAGVSVCSCMRDNDVIAVNLDAIKFRLEFLTIVEKMLKICSYSSGMPCLLGTSIVMDNS